VSGLSDTLPRPSAVTDVPTRLRFLLGLILVTAGAGVFAIAFRASLGALYRSLYGAENVVEAVAHLPRWMRLEITLEGRQLKDTSADRESEIRRESRN
jgi:hypothetical protein